MISDNDIKLRVGKEEYRCKLSGHQEGILLSTKWRYQRRLLNLSKIRKSLGPLKIGRPSAEHSGI